MELGFKLLLVYFSLAQLFLGKTYCLTFLAFSLTNSDPDLFLSFLNALAGICSIGWITFTTQGGGNDNAIILYWGTFMVNIVGAFLVLYRRRRLVAKGLPLPSSESDDEDDVNVKKSSTSVEEFKQLKKVRKRRKEN